MVWKTFKNWSGKKIHLLNNNSIIIISSLFFFFAGVGGTLGLWDLNSSKLWVPVVKALSPNHWTARGFPVMSNCSTDCYWMRLRHVAYIFSFNAYNSIGYHVSFLIT